MNKSIALPQLFLRLFLGLGFILPVADRLGILGLPGEKGVAWGNWQNFVSYTNTLAPFLNSHLSNFAALLVTFAEIIFGLCLIIGFKTKLMAQGSALLTFVFGISMAIFLEAYAPFGYPVFVFTGGAWLLSQLKNFKWSVDNLLRKKISVLL